MRETVRLIAHDVVLIGGALCIVIVLVLLVMRLRISYTWLQTGKAIKWAIQTIVQTVLNPFIAVTAVKQLWDTEKEPKSQKKTEGKKPLQKKTKKK